jgi:hypothetical protein
MFTPPPLTALLSLIQTIMKVIYSRYCARACTQRTVITSTCICEAHYALHDQYSATLGEGGEQKPVKIQWHKKMPDYSARVNFKSCLTFKSGKDGCLFIYNFGTIKNPIKVKI